MSALFLSSLCPRNYTPDLDTLMEGQEDQMELGDLTPTTPPGYISCPFSDCILSLSNTLFLELKN